MNSIQCYPDPNDPKYTIFTIPKGMTREQFRNSHLVLDPSIIKEVEDNNVDVTDISKRQVLEFTLKEKIKNLKDKRLGRRNV